ncbi:BTAD domain-containing putative transcriptional regulator [Streptomyces hesseae]|uniref:BTAD domain-containing putative transcriptional regulator n=1 Tax=Streptomyces hesseae TaxID=3075519 RepID=A0ABU2ST62_9ACTN|nr:BTAD domain-containing putative transcriptional regulator [Streptomyces sp. DSM 40473]MDT0451020.1 BTAD domain-containing putative transcriptional regulator [Streptomyces sp. DSM 40473]
MTHQHLVDAELRLGRHRGVLAGLAALIAGNPLHEGLHGQYMRALYLGGRRATATWRATWTNGRGGTRASFTPPPYAFPRPQRRVPTRMAYARRTGPGGEMSKTGGRPPPHRGGTSWPYRFPWSCCF